MYATVISLHIIGKRKNCGLRQGIGFENKVCSFYNGTSTSTDPNHKLIIQGTHYDRTLRQRRNKRYTYQPESK